MLSPVVLKLYKLNYLLGQGASSAVYKATRRSDGLSVALKVMLRDKVPADRLALDSFGSSSGKPRAVPMEVYILRRLDHPCVIKLLDYFADDRFFYIITEIHGDGQWQGKQHDTKKSCLVSAGVDAKTCAKPTDLFECIERFGCLPPEVAHKIFRQILDALVYLKSRNVFHMDLKDENIVVDKDFNIKIIDFGSAHIIPTDDPTSKQRSVIMTRFFGTLAYAPPEVLSRLAYSPEKGDVWTLGVLYHTMIYGQSPFSSPDNTLKGVMSPKKLAVDVSAEDQSLLAMMLERDPLKRCSIDHVALAL